MGRQPAEPTKSAKCKVADLRVHFKNTYNVAGAVKGRKLNPAITYLEDCAEQKSIKAVRELLINLRANAEIKGLDLDRCVINHVVVQRAVNGRRRTYRAHGRISPYLASNCHVEFHCFEKSAGVARTDKAVPRLTKKQAARRLAIGGAK